MEENRPPPRLTTEDLPLVLKNLATETKTLVDGMADDNCLTPVLVLANDLGNTQVFLLRNQTDSEREQHIQECVQEYKKNNRLVALCTAIEAWMCDEERFRKYLNLDQQAAVEHLVGVGTDEESAAAISSQVIQNVILNMAQMYHILYGDLSLFPASYEGVPFRMESLWGVHQRKAEIIRGIDEMKLEYDSGWRVLAKPGGTGSYTDLLQLDPPSNL